MFSAQPAFTWPQRKRAAISLSFDDARPSQIDCGIPILNRFGVKATFYVSTFNLESRIEGWRQAVRDGHEIGNHTITHPCYGNLAYSRGNPLEDFTLERMARELDGANAIIEDTVGYKPRTFAYPCGNTTVGRGIHTQSYIPLVAERFVAGRMWMSETHNTPPYCDLCKAYGVSFDNCSFTAIERLLEGTYAENGWLILAGHEVGAGGYQTIREDTLEEICRFATDDRNGIWIDTVAAIGAYVAAHARP